MLNTELLELESGVFVLGCDFKKILLKHLDGVKLGFFKASLDLLTDLSFKFLKIILELFLSYISHLICFIDLLAFCLSKSSHFAH